MVQITIIDNQTRIGTDDVEIFIEGDFELKKKTPVAVTTDVNLKLENKTIAQESPLKNQQYGQQISRQTAY